MLFRISADSPVPLGEQIAACVRGAVAEGAAAPGERLPPAREVASALGVNMHTVLRGYQRLRDEGLIELRRGRGAVVTADTTARSRAALLTSLHTLVGEARRLGVADEELVTLLRAALANGPAPA